MARRKRLLGAGALVGVGVVVAAVVAYANLTRIARGVLEQQVQGLTFQTLEVGWNKLVVKGVELKRGKRTVLEVQALRVYPSIWSVFSDTLHISSIEIDGPFVYLVRNADGSFTFPVPEQREGAKQEASSKEEKGRAIRIERLRIKDGRGELLDRSVPGAPAHHAFNQLQLKIHDLVVPQAQGRIPFELTARLVGKREGKVRLEGWYEDGTSSAKVDLALADLFVPGAEPYHRGKHTTAALSDGALDLDLRLQMEQGAYTAKVALVLGKLTFGREGLFLGVPSPVMRRLLEDGEKPFALEAELSGNLKDRSTVQQQILSALLKAVAKRAGEQGVGALVDGLKEGAREAVKESAKDRVLEGLLRR